MSTHLPRTATDLEPMIPTDLTAYFAAGEKPQDRWRVGAEFEKFALDRTTGKQIGFDGPNGIESIYRALADRFGWEPHFEAERLTTLTRGGASLSVEPGGQVELATPPCTNLAAIHDHLSRHLTELRAVTDPARVAWVSVGVSPFSTVDEIPLNPRPRHRLMAEYMPTRCQYGLHMMKATASTQVAVDFASEADCGTKFKVALTLSPVINAAFANSPLEAGRRTGFASFRGHIWHGMDPDRSGLLTDLLIGEFSYQKYADFALDVPLLFVDDGGTLRPISDVTFREYLTHGIDDLYPTTHDWELHLSTIFTEARLKRFLEIRGADATPAGLAVAVPAVWKGLLYDATALAAAAELCKEFPPGELAALSEATAQSGLAAVHRGRPIRDWCREIVDLAASGLRASADVSFLDPLVELLADGRSLGERPVPEHHSPALWLSRNES